MEAPEILALRRAIVSGGYATPHSCQHCADIKLPPIPTDLTLLQRSEDVDKMRYSGWSQPIRLSRMDAQQRASAGCAWWAFIYKQIRRHELLTKAKMKWKVETDIRGQDIPDKDDDDELHGLESLSLSSDEARILEKYLDRMEFKQLLNITKAENLFSGRIPSSPIDSLDSNPDLIRIKYRFQGKSLDYLKHLELSVNLTLFSDDDLDGVESGTQSYESTFLVLAVPGDLNRSVSIALPISVNPGSSDSFSLMRHWMRCCETSHSCGFTKAPNEMPSMLLDVQSLASEDTVKIFKVAATTKERYIALSYCWGPAGQKVMNLEETRKSLLAGIRTEALDRSIRDAVITTRELGFKYIWIDALCIPQDDNEAKAKEISRIAQIYGGSTLTIYASRASSVQEGFLAERKPAGWGLDEEYRQQVVFQVKAKSENEEVRDTKIILIPEPSLTEETQIEPLQQRAWALQELVLPMRRLSFGTHQTTWTCLYHSADLLRDGWTDSGTTIKSLVDTVYVDAARIVQRMSSMRPDEIRKNWYHLVELFNRRQISFKSDRMPAISALAKVYCSMLKDEYLCGHWKSTLPIDLLWMCGTSRPKSSGQALKPSWSWISYDSSYDSPYDSHPSWDREAEFVQDNHFEILGCQVHPKYATDIFGELDEARLQVRGLVYHPSPEGMRRHPITGRPPQATSKDINYCSLSDLASLEDMLQLRHSTVFYDYKDPELSTDHSHTDFYSSLYMLLVAYVRDPHEEDRAERRGRSPRGLVLFCHQDGSFSRVGKFSLCKNGVTNRDGRSLYSRFPDNDDEYNKLVWGMWRGEIREVVIT